MRTKALKDEPKPKCRAPVGMIIINGPNEGINEQTEKYLLAWLKENGWKDLVLVEIRPQSTNSNIEFVPCEWQSNPLQAFSLKTSPDMLVTLLSRWLYEVF